MLLLELDHSDYFFFRNLVDTDDSKINFGVGLTPAGASHPGACDSQADLGRPASCHASHESSAWRAGAADGAQ